MRDVRADGTCPKSSECGTTFVQRATRLTKRAKNTERMGITFHPVDASLNGRYGDYLDEVVDNHDVKVFGLAVGHAHHALVTVANLSAHNNLATQSPREI